MGFGIGNEMEKERIIWHQGEAAIPQLKNRGEQLLVVSFLRESARMVMDFVKLLGRYHFKHNDFQHNIEFSDGLFD